MLFLFLPLGIMSWWFLRWFFLPSYKRISSVEIETPRSLGVPLPLHKDDFTLLKGVGPKTAAGLFSAGIYTFEQLGLMDPDQLTQTLKDQGLPSGTAAFWQQLAVLAAAEDWEGLQKLQD
jgi:predicted flap endonuclease-1-like 5' DNA nuclease